MSTDNILDYSAVLADLEAKRSMLDATIASLKMSLAAGIVGKSTTESAPAVVSTGPAMTADEIPAGAFLRKSIPEATKLYLSIVKQKQTTRQIADALAKGGMETTSNNFEGTVSAGLNRHRKLTGEIVRVKNAWGLAEWYPAGLRAQQPVQKKNRKKKQARKVAKPEVVATPKAGASRKNGAGIQSVMGDWLRSNPQSEYSADQVAAALQIDNVKTTQLILGKLVAAGVAKKTDSGKYRTVDGQTTIQ